MKRGRTLLPLREPLLRTPPFPGIDRAATALSEAGSSADAGGAVQPGRQAAIFALLRDNRVGGAFWGIQPALPDGPFTLVCARSADDARRMAEGLKGTVVAHLPSRARVGTAICWSGEIDPWPVLAAAEAIHCHGDSEWSALAWIAGRKPILHSVGALATAEDVATALCSSRYRDPFTGVPTDIETVIGLLAEWRALIDANRSICAATGIAWWKRREIASFLWAPRSRPLFVRSARRALSRARLQGGSIATWPSRAPPRLADMAEREDIPLLNIEDGFIRSVGLGSNLYPPQSVAVDGRGIYYDPGRPSDLEHLLASAEFSPALLERAAELRQRLVAAGIDKYGSRPGDFPDRQPGRRLVLVAGQVEDDESVLRAGSGVAGNLDLLTRARTLEPDTELWFRPHPDVDAGHRVGAVPDAQALQHADRVVRGGGMAQLLERVDAVHVLSSLTGFEALLRGREVVVHGSPFFAGWGLTRDMGQVPARRGRKLSLDALVAATLILYPRYLDPVTRLPCPVEILISRFGGGPQPRGTLLNRLRILQGRLAQKSLWKLL